VEIENQYKPRIKRFRSDGGGEYTSAAFNRLLSEAGIVREQTAPYSPEQNAVSERANRTLIGRAKAMMFAAGLPDEMWGEAVHTAVYLKNRSLTSALEKSMTPLEAMTGEIPKLGALISFGAKGFKHVPKELRTKWEPNSVPCIFTGYAGTNQFRVLIDRRIHITRDLTIADGSTNETVVIPPPGLVPISLADDSDEDSTTSAADHAEPKPPTPEPPAAERTIPTPETPPRTQTPGGFPIDTPEETIYIRPPQAINPPPQEPIYSQRPRRANAGKFTSTRFHDETFSSLATLYPNPNSYNCQAYNTMGTTEPTTYTEAIRGYNNAQ